MEQPAGAASYTEGGLDDLPGSEAIFDQCRLGAVMKDSHGTILGPAKKRTKVKSTKENLCKELQKYQCQCPEGTHQHVRGKAGQDLQNYPAKLCRLLAKELSDVEILFRKIHLLTILNQMVWLKKLSENSKSNCALQTET